MSYLSDNSNLAVEKGVPLFKRIPGTRKKVIASLNSVLVVDFNDRGCYFNAVVVQENSVVKEFCCQYYNEKVLKTIFKKPKPNFVARFFDKLGLKWKKFYYRDNILRTRQYKVTDVVIPEDAPAEFLQIPLLREVNIHRVALKTVRDEAKAIHLLTGAIRTENLRINAKACSRLMGDLRKIRVTSNKTGEIANASFDGCSDFRSLLLYYVLWQSMSKNKLFLKAL